jgi:hypothetical protein
MGGSGTTGWRRPAIRRPGSSRWLIRSWTLTASPLLHRKAIVPDAGLMKQLRRRETGAAEAAQLAEIATGRPAGAGTLVAEARAHHIEACHR